MKALALASLIAVATAAIVSLAWLGLYIWLYRQGRYSTPLLVSQIDQLVIALLTAAIVVALLLRNRPASIARCVAVAVIVAGSVRVLWLALWNWMTRYYSPTHVRIDLDIPWWSFDPQQVLVVVAGGVLIFGTALVVRRGAV